MTTMTSGAAMTETRRLTVPNPASAPRGRRRVTVGGVIRVVGLALWLLITLFPLYWIALTSFKSPGTINRYPIEYWPSEPSLANYVSLFEKSSFGVFLANSAIVALTAGAVATAIALLSAYVLARFEFRGKGAVLIAFLLTQMIPAFIALGPLYSMMSDLGLVDTKPGLILVYIAICIPFCTFVMRGFFLTVPWEIQEAAYVDGAGSWTVFWKIMFPMARAPMILLLLIQFTWIWNDLLFGLVLSKSETVRPVMVALVGMQGVYGAQDGPSVIAATLICSAPTLILFLFLQRYFVRGLTLGVSGGR